MKNRDKILNYIKNFQYEKAASLIESQRKRGEHSKNSYIVGVQLYFNMPDREKCLRDLDYFVQNYASDVKSLMFCLNYYERLNCIDNALNICENFFKKFPDNIEIYAEYGKLLQQKGNFIKANQFLLDTIERFGLDAQILRICSLSVNGSNIDPSLLQNMENTFHRGTLSDFEKINFAYALGKFFEDLDDFEKSYYFLSKGNYLQSQMSPYNFSDRINEVKKYLNVQASIPYTNISSCEQTIPIFINGLPRSGTTLIENKIAQHLSIDSAGEVAIAFRAHYHYFHQDLACGYSSQNFEQNLKKFGDHYLAQLQSRFSMPTKYITDKSMRNFLIAPYLKHAFSRSKIIFSQRNPEDIAQSMFRNYFQVGTHKYACNINDIAKEIAIFDHVIHYLHRRYPDFVIKVRYEDFVANPNSHLSNICETLNIKKQTHSVANRTLRTLSAFQARQPIQTNRINAWRRYPELFSGFSEKIEAARELIKKELPLDPIN